MNIIDVYWTKIINILVIECDCKNIIKHRSDRWNVFCNKCGKKENLGKLRGIFKKEGGFKNGE